MSLDNIFLPGLDEQCKFLRGNLTSAVQNALVIGSASELCALFISELYSCPVELVVGDYESLLNSKINLGDNEAVKISLMDFEITDFEDSSFDLIYAQASISSLNRNKIIRELKRILRPGGYLCVGEIVSLKNDIPQFVKDIFDSSDLLPTFIGDFEKYYIDRNFEVIARYDLSKTLQDYYSKSASLLKNAKGNLDDKEKSYYKKLLNKISHESNAYLKLGGDKYIGFTAALLKKGEN